MNRALVALSFCIVAFGQPAWIGGFGLIASGLGFALFWLAMLSFQSPRERFWLSVIWFTSVQGVQLSWMTTLDYMGPLILVVFAFLIIAMGVQFGLLSFLIQKPITLSRALAIAGSWTLFEWMRLFFLCGFTWNPVGLALADSSYALQFASLFGVFGLSFWVILVNIAGLTVFLEKSGKAFALWAVLALSPYLYGFLQQTWVDAYVPVKKTLNVALIQTGLFPEQKDFLHHAPHAYIAPTVQLERIFHVLDTGRQIDLVLFPEAALPMGAHMAGYDLQEVKKFFEEEDLPPLQLPYALYRRGWKVCNAFVMQALANHFHCHVIIGLDDADGNKKYNAAFHFQPDNLPYARYEKRVLAPIAEYVPLRQWHRFSQFVARQFGIYSSFTPGQEAKIFQTVLPTGVSICLEETFGHLIRELRHKGAELFVNLTNDVWFPRSRLPQQHFDHGRVRAAENGVCILRACNTGVTGAIDCFGRPLKQLPVSETEASVLYVSLPVRSYSTLYTWWGDGAILAISLGGLLFHLRVVRKSCRK